MKKISKLWKEANKFIPTGNSFLSKNPSRFPVKNWPIYFHKSKGCKIWDLNNKKYYDFSFMGVGTNILGYSDNEINKKVIDCIKKGNVTTLNCPEEVEFSKLIVKIHPWSKMVKFAKTGAEANAIAVRLARAFNKKNKIIVCGYHGWHDWYLAAKLKKKNILDTHLFPSLKVDGVPNFLKGSTYAVKYNDLDIIKLILKKDKDISAIIMEVERDQKPKSNYLNSIRKICDQNNICLIFDECTSGFRETYGGIHLKYNVNPDLAMFGKAISNGNSLTAVIGKKKIMEKAKNTFMSSTFWSDRVGFVAGLATLKKMKKIKSWTIINKKGKLIKKKLTEIANKNKLNIQFWGTTSLIKFEIVNIQFKEYKNFIISEMLKRKFLAGNTIYVSTTHTDKLINLYINEMDRIFKKISKFQK